MSDTPETDEQINGKPCTRFAIYAGDSLRDALVPSEFARKLERERDRYKSDVEVITKERDEVRKQLRVVVGMLSATPQFQDQHPEEVLKFVEEAAK